MKKALDPSRSRYVCGISWPRSGHQLLVDILESYFGGEFAYCEFYTPVDCCKKSPCTRAPMVKFSKNHDFESKTGIRRGTPYLVQYRSFLPSVVSAFEMYVQNGQPDTADSFRFFARYLTTRYNAFLAKWTFGPNAPKEKLLIRYESLTSESKIEVLTDIISFFAPDHSIDELRLLKITRSAQKVQVDAKQTTMHFDFGIRATRIVEEFRFFNGALFDELRLLTCESEALANQTARFRMRESITHSELANWKKLSRAQDTHTRPDACERQCHRPIAPMISAANEFDSVFEDKCQRQQ